MPRLTQAQAPLTRSVEVVDEFGQHAQVDIPAERALTLYVDKRELVTLMTLGAHPEWLVLGYLRNQGLVQQADEIESVTVDWDVGAAAVKTRSGLEDLEARTAHRVVTTGCGQGSVFSGLMDQVDSLALPDTHIQQSHLVRLVDIMRLQDTTYKSAGSVHACALFTLTPSADVELKIMVEDVGRHNAIDTIAGWMWMNPQHRWDRVDKVFYTTGRLTSEMVIKAAQMDVAIVVSRSGITQMGLEIAERLGLCTIGRATHRRFLCYSGKHRLQLQPEWAERPRA